MAQLEAYRRQVAWPGNRDRGRAICASAPAGETPARRREAAVPGAAFRRGRERGRRRRLAAFESGAASASRHASLPLRPAAQRWLRVRPQCHEAAGAELPSAATPPGQHPGVPTSDRRLDRRRTMGRTCEPIAPRFRAWFGMPAIQRVTPALCDQRGLAEVLLLHRRPPPCGPSRDLAVVGEVGRIASNRRVASESGHAAPPLEISAELSKTTGDITLDSEAGGSVTPRSAREVRCQWGGKARSSAIPGASKRRVLVLLPGVARLSQDRSDEHCCLRPQEFRPNTRYRLERGDISRKSRQSFAGCAAGLTKAALRPIINARH